MKKEKDLKKDVMEDLTESIKKSMINQEELIKEKEKIDKQQKQKQAEFEKAKKKKKKEEINPIFLHKHFHKNMKAERLKDYTVFQQGGFLRRFFRKKQYDLNLTKAILINFELDNGDHITFIAYEKDGGFLYKKKKYLFDYESYYYNISSKMYCYDFHENLCLPIQRRIPVETLKDEIENDIGDEKGEGYAQVRYLTNPKTLYEYSIAKLAEGILRGAALEAWLKRIFFITIITLFVTIVIIIMIYIRTRGVPAPIPVTG